MASHRTNSISRRGFLRASVFGAATSALGSLGMTRMARAVAISLIAVLYYLRSPMRIGGDEYDIAVNLGITTPFVEIPFALGYPSCLMVGLRELPRNL